MSYELLNPEGEHLPTIDLPFKVIHLSFAIFWAIPAVISIIMLIIERVKRKAYRLIHALLLGICLLFVCMHSIFHVYWKQVSVQGYSDEMMSIIRRHPAFV